MILRLIGAALVVASGCDARGGVGEGGDEVGGAGGRLPAAEAPHVPDSVRAPTLPTDAESMAEGEAAPLESSSEPAADSAGQSEPESRATGGASEATAPATADDATEILLRAERAYDAVRSMRAAFTQDLTVPLLGSSQRSSGQIFHRKPDRFLMRFSDPEGDVVVADGRYVWLYYPSSDPKQVLRTSVGEAGRLDLQREFLSNPTERFNATLDGTESVDGRPASALTLLPRQASTYRKVRIWVDGRDDLVRRFEITENNDAVRRVELRDLQTNLTLADSLFSFTPPAGTQVFDQ